MKRTLYIIVSLALLAAALLACTLLAFGTGGQTTEVYALQPDVEPIYGAAPDSEPVYGVTPDTAPTQLALLEPPRTPSAGDFTDVPADAWYYAALDRLVADGGINGMTEDTFCPDDTMTVEQFIKTLVGCTFTPESLAWYDTGDENARWSAKYISAAYYIGALSGFDITEEHLTQPVTRCEAAWLLVRFAAWGGETLTVPDGIRRAITDYAAIPEIARDAVAMAYGAGLITGYPDGSFGPNGTLRRCEAAVTIVRLLRAEDRVPVVIPPYVYDYAAPVPEGEAVDVSYFSDAVFVGNSLCDGFALYSGLDQGTFLGATSVSVNNVWADGREATLTNNAYGKVYVMLGINEIGSGVDNVAALYDSFLQKLQTLQPQGDIYVQAVLPVCESMLSSGQVNGGINNANIQALNARLQTVCANRQVYFVNLWEAYADSTGALPASLCWDGVHLNVNAYAAWLTYLQTHTVQEG